MGVRLVMPQKMPHNLQMKTSRKQTHLSTQTTRRAPPRLARRLTVPLSAETAAALLQEANRAGVSMASVARQTLDQGIAQLQRTRLEQALAEGYQATSDEARALALEMNAVRDWGDR